MKLTTILCMALSLFLAGCAPSMLQTKNVWKAINGKEKPSSYSKNCIADTFGIPYSKSVSFSDGVRQETWVYKTNLKDKYLIINMRPAKARYMKVEFSDGAVSDCSFE